MNLGNFSISLTVKDLGASRAFYEKLGFNILIDQSEQNWMILKNGSSVIGLFKGMFDQNIMTFNPGWDADGNPVDPFDDVRQIYRSLKSAGVDIPGDFDDSGSGPASFVVHDPDGNSVMIDQHR